MKKLCIGGCCSRSTLAAAGVRARRSSASPGRTTPAGSRGATRSRPASCKKWAEKYGIEIELTLVNDYVESINLYTAGKFDACAMTNMDALTIPAVGGIDSHRADRRRLLQRQRRHRRSRTGKTVKDLKGRSVKLVEFTVSHYMLARALEMNGMTEKDVKTVNTSDADIAAVFAADANGAAVTWNPPLQQARNAKGATLVFDSSKIPGEIIDLMVVRTNAPDSLKKALTGAWYETMSGHDRRRQGRQRRDRVHGEVVRRDGARVQGAAQHHGACSTSRPMRRRSRRAPQLKKTMEYVRTFTLQQGPVRQAREAQGLRRHRIPGRQRARRREEREAALRRRLHAAGRRRQAVSPLAPALAAPDRRSAERRAARAGAPRCAARLLPFVLIAAVYLCASHLRLAENPQDKLLPSASAQMARAMRAHRVRARPAHRRVRSARRTPGRACGARARRVGSRRSPGC